MLLEHQHLLVRAEILTPIKHPAGIEDWTRRLIQDCGMGLLMGPRACCSERSENQGLTCVSVTETTHLSVHIWDEAKPAVLQLDISSCAEFDPYLIYERIREDFRATRLEYKVLDRESERSDTTAKGTFVWRGRTPEPSLPVAPEPPARRMFPWMQFRLPFSQGGSLRQVG